MTTVDGTCDPGFEGVREEFARNLEERGELGAGFCVRVGGRTVVDLWGGHRDIARTRRWERDTLVNAWSVGKGVISMLALYLVERGELSLDEPVAERWPAFAAEGKETVTLRILLAHQAGLPSVRAPLHDDAWREWSTMCDALAGQAPWWEPGTAHGYHTNTFGFLVGELIRRATGWSPGEALQRLLAGPAGADFFWGLPAEHHARVAEVDSPGFVLRERAHWEIAFPPTGDEEHDTMVWHGYFNPPSLSGLGVMGTPEWLAAEVPSTNGHATACGVATLYDALLHGQSGSDGRPWVSPGLLREATRIHSDGDDRVLGRPSRFGLGFQLPRPERPLGPHGSAFGHYGYGGLLGMADPEADLALGFLTSRPGDRWQTPRTLALVDAVYASIGAAPEQASDRRNA